MSLIDKFNLALNGLGTFDGNRRCLEIEGSQAVQADEK